MNPEQRHYADLGSRVAAELIMARNCVHERKCGCYGRHRTTAWLALDALIHDGWTLTPPGSYPVQVNPCKTSKAASDE